MRPAVCQQRVGNFRPRPGSQEEQGSTRNTGMQKTQVLGDGEAWECLSEIHLETPCRQDHLPRKSRKETPFRNDLGLRAFILLCLREMSASGLLRADSSPRALSSRNHRRPRLPAPQTRALHRSGSQDASQV